MSSPISSALAKLDENLQLLQSQVDGVRAGLELSDDQLSSTFAETRRHAAVVRDLIRAERSDAKWTDRASLDLLIRELELAALERRNQQRRTRLLSLANEFEAGTVKHRFEARSAALNALRMEAVTALRSDASLPQQDKELPGPDANQWLSWACSLQESTDEATLALLRRDFAAVERFTTEMEETYWVPGKPGQVPAAPSTPAVAPTPAPQPPKATVQPPKPPAPIPVPAPPRQVTPPPPTVTMPAVQPSAPARVAAVAAVSGVVAAEKTASVAKTQPEKVAQSGAAAGTAPAYERPAAPPPQLPESMRRPQPGTPVQLAPVAVKPAVEKQPAAIPTGKVCDKCGSTYPLQFNVCPIDSTALRVVSEAAPVAAAPASAPQPVKKAEAPKPAVVAVTEAPKAPAPAKPAATPAPAPGPEVRKPNGDGTKQLAEYEAQESKRAAKRRAAEARAAASAAAAASPAVNEDEVAEETADTDLKSKLSAMLGEKGSSLATNPLVLGGIALLLVLVVGTIVWMTHRSPATPAPAAKQATSPAQSVATASTAEASAPVTTVTASPSNSKTESQQQSAKTQDQANNSKQNAADAANAKPDAANNKQVLSLPAPGLNAKKKDDSANTELASMPGSVPGALPGAAAGGVGNIVNLPVAAPTISGGQRVKVSSGVAQGSLVRQITPEYPQQARQQRVQGTVVLQAVIGKDGSVQAVKVVSGPALLTKSAMQAVKQWRYKPFALNGEAVEADTQINVKFTLGE